MANSNNFNIPKLIKDENDQDKCYEILLENIYFIRTFYRHCQEGSDKYPQVSFERVFWHLENINKYSNPSLKKNQKVQRSKAEVAFIAATKGDETIGLKSALQRRELIEFIIRVAQTWMQAAYGSAKQTSKYLGEFINTFIKPYYDDSLIIKQGHRLESHQSSTRCSLITSKYLS